MSQRDWFGKAHFDSRQLCSGLVTVSITTSTYLIKTGKMMALKTVMHKMIVMTTMIDNHLMLMF